VIKLDVKITSNTWTPKSQRARRALSNLPKEAYDVFYDTTPVRTGNARRNTKLTGANVIQAQYPYADKLDRGYSRQAPQGMIKPTLAYVRRRLNQIKGM